ncbi:MAG: hydroxyacylglutathione hydrolase [Acidocella sp. 20-57-95]|nr:MAG: hydroxyacylglutathione hydrolase [Acidocella sp. 20-57-95]OYV62459.1 MAG: hydroxyacylglutathione hydrolase [Acidocella sp. 21-58-7]HQT64092.1 hydroxyacylglutathione hydrolase [Acidocella sp.]HQU03691.1 hydroxyacylglutathione hydrolase [Acidocella sp.]
MTVTATAIPMLTDNYAWLLRESAAGAVGIVDPAEAEPAIAAIEAAGGKLDVIFITHHHGDHIGGVAALVARYHPLVVGNAADAHRLPKLDVPVREGDLVTFGNTTAELFNTPGHTIGHIAYYFADGGVLLPGDTLFSLGCGRLFEGTAEDMFSAFQKFARLPDETLVCAGHEYTASNAKFALAKDPENAALQARAAEITALRVAGKATLPVTLGEERLTNPFMRAPTAAAFGALRTAKDKF